MICDECQAMSFDDDVCDECGAMMPVPQEGEEVIKPGDRVWVTDVNGVEHSVMAKTTAVRGQDMAVVWVDFGDGETFPWPEESVRLAVPDA